MVPINHIFMHIYIGSVELIGVCYDITIGVHCLEICDAV